MATEFNISFVLMVISLSNLAAMGKIQRIFKPEYDVSSQVSDCC